MESITIQEPTPSFFGIRSNHNHAQSNTQWSLMTQTLMKPIGRMFYLHRCGVALDASRAGEFSHPACHTAPARVFGTDTFLHVSGGWHDAGDYGRYVVPACKAVADLLLAFRAAPEAFGDDWDIPESGNGVADVLDEVRFELEWLLKMQRDDGGVYHKVTCAYFPSITTAPQDETADLFVFPVSTSATGDFSAVMALAAPLYESIDRTFSKKCLRASINAYEFLKQNKPLPFHNPSGVVTGEYDDEHDDDERYFAACALYQATGQTYYLSDASALYQGGRSADLGWANVAGYGNAILYFGPRACEDDFLVGRIRADLLATAERICERTEKSPLGISLSEFLWGSNMYLLNHTMALLLANDAQENERYLSAARSHLSYILGANPMGVNFITGVSEHSPKNPHHRPSAAMNHAMPGMLVGGPDEGLHDLAAKTLLAGKPAAERYLDSVESYSTNETAIYWNSVLLYVVARMSKLGA